MKPNLETADEYFHEALKLLENPKKYDKAIHLLNKADRCGSFFATYILAGELNKEMKYYPSDPERSDEFYKRALPFLEVVPESDPSYARARHYLSTYYIYGYAGIERDLEKGLDIEQECVRSGFADSMKFLSDYYSDDEHIDLVKSDYYSDLYKQAVQVESTPEVGEEIAEDSEEEESESEPVKIENIAEIVEPLVTDIDEEKVESPAATVDVAEQETEFESMIAEEIESKSDENVLPLPSKGEDPAVDAHRFFVTDEERRAKEGEWENVITESMESTDYEVNEKKACELPSDKKLDSEGKFALAMNIFETEDRERYQEALDLLTAVLADYPVQANCYLGDLYNQGKYIDADLLKATHYYSQARQQHSPYATFHLGFICFYTEPGEKLENKEAGLAYIKEAASAGYAPALYELGEIYNYGRGGMINKKAAAEFYQLALDRGYEKARAALVEIR